MLPIVASAIAASTVLLRSADLAARGGVGSSFTRKGLEPSPPLAWLRLRALARAAGLAHCSA